MSDLRGWRSPAYNSALRMKSIYPLAVVPEIVIPPAKTAPKESAQMQKLEVPLSGGNEALIEKLQSRLIGHDKAARELVDAITRHQAGLGAKNRPVGAFLLVGPTGSGKTQIARALCDLVTSKTDSLIRIDCAEFGASHEVSKLIGAPPGYLGHRETASLLAQAKLTAQTSDSNKISVVLFDEIDKAHAKLLDLLLGIMDAARLTLGDNSTVDFSRTLVLMTANMGAKEMQSILRPGWGFAKHIAHDPDAHIKAGASGEAAAKKSLRPEFINRLDKILVFHQLTLPEIEKVCDLELAALEERCLTGPSIGLSVSAAARRWLAREGYEPEFGARHLKRQIERLVEKPLAALVTTQAIRGGQVVRVELAEGQLEFYA